MQYHSLQFSFLHSTTMTLAILLKKHWTAPDKWTRLKVHAPWFCAFSRYHTQLFPCPFPVISGPQCPLLSDGRVQLSASHRHKAPPPICPLWNVLAAPSFWELLHGRSLYRVRLIWEVVISHIVYTSSRSWRTVHRKTASHATKTEMIPLYSFQFVPPRCFKRHHNLCSL